MMAQPLSAPAHAATEELLREGSIRVRLAFCRLPPDVRAALEDAPATRGQVLAKPNRQTVVRHWRETKARVDGRSFVHGLFDNAGGGGGHARSGRRGSFRLRKHFDESLGHVHARRHLRAGQLKAKRVALGEERPHKRILQNGSRHRLRVRERQHLT
jgi:hypothetical protein